MKKLSTILILLFATIFSVAQENYAIGYQDTHKKSERYQIIKKYFDYSFTVYNELKENFSLLTDYRKSNDIFVGYSSILKVPYFHIPFCYIFQEDENWTKRVYRHIDINDQRNELFSKKTKDFWYSHQDFLAIIFSGIEDGSLYPFIRNDNLNDSTLIDSILNLREQIDYIKIKEDWTYNKNTGKITPRIIDISFFVKNKPEVELFWIFYPQLRHILQGKSVYIEESRITYTWSDFIENHMFKTTSYTEFNHREYDFEHDDRYYNDYKKHRNDLDALWNFQLLNEYTDKDLYKFSGTISDSSNHEYVKGEMKNGFKVGEWKVYHSNGKLRLIVHFKNNIPNGNYEEYWSNGNLKEKGIFQFGLKEGIWFSYFESGKIMSEKKYTKGWMDGKQTVWYDNGNIHLKFQYQDFKLNGDFERWRKDGSLMEKGKFKNNYMDSFWTINLKITDWFKKLVLENENIRWSFDSSAVIDGFLTYDLEIKQKFNSEDCHKYGRCIEINRINEIR